MKRLVAFTAMAFLVNAQDTRSVTGTATYRERIALPPHAVFEASLQDVSRADAPAVVIGTARLDRPGQPPFRFSIPYDPAKINERNSYVMRARVTVDGNLMFTTTQSYPVLTRGNGAAVEMLLQRVAAPPASPKPAAAQSRPMSGMFRYMADAALFMDCESRQRLPVAMEEQYKALEEAYTKTRRQPDEELMVEIEGEIANRPRPDGGQPVPTLIVTRYIGVWPGETCGNPGATSSLQETYWKLTRLDGKPIVLAERQREPYLILRIEQSGVAGFGGCNGLGGSYTLDGANIAFGPLISTMMACAEGMDTERSFHQALSNTRTWTIAGEHLEFRDSEGNLLARFEAVALR